MAFHSRCWKRYVRIENPKHVEKIKKFRKKSHFDRQTEVFLSLGKLAYDFIDTLSVRNQAMKKNIEKLLKLKDEYGEKSLLYAMDKAMNRKLYGADYIENILYQEMTPMVDHPPVALEKTELNNIRLKSTSLKEYDALALKRKKKL